MALREPHKKALITGLRLAMCLALLVAVFMLFDLQAVGERFSHLSAPVVLLAVIFHIAIILSSSWRFAIVASAAGAQISSAEACRLTFYSTLGNLLLPSSLAGDAGRVWLIRRNGLDLRRAMSVGIFDRIVGLAALSLVTLAGASFAPTILPLWMVLGLCAGAAGVLWLVGRFNQASFRPNLLTTGALSISGHLLSVLIAWVFLSGQDVAIGLPSLLVLFPAVLLAASLPVSIGGWGTRELASVTVFATIAMESDLALALALFFGLTQVTAALIGTLLFLMFLPQQQPVNQ